MKKSCDLIICPHCGCEYVPAEIFLPDSFLGKPFLIERESISGKIINYFGSSMDLDENYICDRCNQPFSIHAKIQFETEGTDFRKDYTTKIKKPSLFFDEE